MISRLLLVSLFCTLLGLAPYPVQCDESTPNIVYIMSDELAYFELSHMGNPYIKTPHIDKMAAEGIRFTNAYAASPVCAPLRGQMMTGKHSGHASVRANDGGTPLREDEITIATMLKQKNYATGGFGKWGAGGRDSTGVPEKHGFDVFLGYYDQVHAHSFYPPYIIRNSEEVVLKGNKGGRSGETYAHYPIMEEGLQFIRENKDGPFFAYFPITPPHGMFDIPADDPAWDLYKDEEWINDPSISQDTKNYAAMVTMIDNNLGSILGLLKELQLDKETIVFFTGDNGGQDRFKSKQHPRGFFGPNVDPKTGIEFRGGKGSLYEGGLKIPFLVRWPEKISAGRVSHFMFAQYDIMATLADISGTKAPEDTDGISILPELLGNSQKGHEMFYWEYGNQTAVRWGKWKGIQPNKTANWDLYDLEKDISETSSVASEYKDVIQTLQEFAKSQHTPVQPGSYHDPDRVRHERDRAAKWGSTRKDLPKLGKINRIRATRVDPEEISIISFSSENHQNDRLAAYAIDGKPNTLWHSNFSNKPAKPPHSLVVELGKNRLLKGIEYLARQDTGWNGAFAKVNFYLSNNKNSWPEAPALEIQFSKTKLPQSANFYAPYDARFVKVEIISEVNGADFASAADIAFVVAEEEAQTQDLAFLDKWTNAKDSWSIAKEVKGSPEKKEWIHIEEGKGILYNGEEGKGVNIVSNFQHQDCEVHIEYMIPKGSNSGVYFMERYEVQILDSYGKSLAGLHHGDHGGIYQRWNKEAPKGAQGFEGTPPSANPSKAPGEWQKMEVVFRAPRFDASGKKMEKARFVSVTLNGVNIHTNTEVTGATRGGKEGDEVPRGALKIQGDHGPIAFRKILVKPLQLP